MSKKAKTPSHDRHLSHDRHPKTHPSKTTTPKSSKSSKLHYYGIHAIYALLQARPTDACVLFVQDQDSPALAQIVACAMDLGLSIQSTTKEKLAALCGSHNHQGVVLLANTPALCDETVLDGLCQKPNALFLVLDQITDAHNLGACLRTACAMGVDAVIVPRHHSASLSPTVAKVSVGASELVPVVFVTNLARTLGDLKKQGVFVFGTTLGDEAVSVFDCDFLGKVAIVMGSEAEGMRRLTTELCDTLVFIPMHAMQSLNVSVATGMVLYEVARQRTHRPT